MSLQRADLIHAVGCFDAASGNAYNVQGLHGWTRVGLGVYTVVCDEAISGRESTVDARAGINEVLLCAGRVGPDDTTITIRCYDTFQNPADAVTLTVEVLHTQTGPTGDVPEPPIPAPIPPPVGLVSSVFGRIGAVVAQLGDYTSSLVTNASTVVGATVTDALNTIATSINAILVTLGSLTSSMIANASGVAGVTVTNALNTLDAALGVIALTVSDLGARVLSAVPYITGFSATRYEGTVDPFSGATAATLCVMMSPTQFDGSFQQLCGNNAGLGGGVSLALFNNSLLAQAWDSGGAQQTQFVNVPAVRLWNIVAVTVDTSGADMIMEIWWNGSRVLDATIGGAGGALPAGGVFTIGAAPGGALPAGATAIQGAGYAARVATPAEFAEQFSQALALGTLPDLSGGFDGAYRVNGADPGDPWVPFVGADDLTRIGAAAAFATDDLPIYRTG